MKRLCILGVNGFIGHHLSARILRERDWEIHGMDVRTERLGPLIEHPRFHFFAGDITQDHDWIADHIRLCDDVLPLVAIATPAAYVRDPLGVFELDFEANLPIVRQCAREGRRVIFPSTSEVYGMSRDAAFDAEESELVYGPIRKTRWMYACAKQLMDRVIAAYGQQHGLNYTLFRPFNWIGPGLDSIHTAREGSSRVVTQFLGHILRGEAIHLVDGGHQKRTFTHIDDGIDALLKIIDNAGDRTNGRIYNIGNPHNDHSVRELAHMMLALAVEYPEFRGNAARVRLLDTTAEAYYGPGYQDVLHRVPHIANTSADLDWSPRVDMATALRAVFDSYRDEAGVARRQLNEQLDPAQMGQEHRD